MSDNVILFGKYIGLTYEELVEKDLNYCKFLLSFKYTNSKNEDLIKYLKEREDIVNKKILNRRLEQTTKLFG
jgi:hypothetical protein